MASVDTTAALLKAGANPRVLNGGKTALDVVKTCVEDAKLLDLQGLMHTGDLRTVANCNAVGTLLKAAMAK